MNINNALINLELNNKYNINNIAKLKLNELKKQYHILALNYHPDKNNNHFSKEHFQNINNSYLFLKNIIEYDATNSFNNNENIDENIEINNEYYNLIINFINIITKDINNNISVTDFQNNCKKYIYEIIEKFINKLNLNVLEEIYKILNNIDTNSINIDEKIKNIILENIKSKLKNYNIYIINTKLNNIINSEVYIMKLDNKTIYIPLWHNELNDNNNIFKIEPILDDNISIDDNNNIHYKYYNSYENIINLIRENNNDFPHIEIIIDKYNLAIPIKELFFKKYQTYIFKEIGIPKINIKNIFENNNKANIIIHIYLI